MLNFSAHGSCVRRMTIENSLRERQKRQQQHFVVGSTELCFTIVMHVWRILIQHVLLLPSFLPDYFHPLASIQACIHQPTLNKEIEMDSQCLFCVQRTTAACCAACRQMNRAHLFENLLTRLGRASNTVNHLDQMKAITERIETVSFILIHCQSNATS